ncbi:MAG: peptidoglycan DD-metalloendopeptidase family protein [Candidatus Berkelbacteria bacterium]|nr:peptidoglycan DD-metalloendopeptidase family protein [Candidatus Berkelbacteria bacterium]
MLKIKETCLGSRQSRRKRGRVFKRIIFALILFCFILYPLATTNADSIADKQRQLNQLNNQIKENKKLIEQKRQEAQNLANAIAILDGQIKEAELALEATRLQISETNDEIAAKEEELRQQNKILDESLRLMYEEKETSLLETLLSSKSFSAVLDRIEYLSVVKTKIDATIQNIKKIKSELEAKKASLEVMRKQQEATTLYLNSQKQEKDKLLADTKGQEDLYQQQLAANKKAYSQTKTEMEQMESAANYDNYNAPASPFGFSWPTDSHSVACGWHCYHTGNYWHSGIDVGGDLRVPIFAAAEGDVMNGYNGQQDPSNRNTWGYRLDYGNYVKIDHGSGFQTLYGHLLYSTTVQNGQHVVRGQLIGLMDCTGYCSGHHLHFEIRYNGTPVNPLPYLP